MTWHDALILPIMVPFTGAIVASLVSGRASAWVALVTSMLTASAGAAILYASVAFGPQVYWVGGWAPPFGIIFVSDIFSSILALTTAVVATASAFTSLTSGEAVSGRRLYHTLFLLLLAALGGLFLTGDLFNLYVFMEMVILSSFALVAMADKSISPEATFKYAALSAVGSLMLLLSIALVYAGVGTLNMADIGNRIRTGAGTPFWDVAAATMLFAFLLKGAIFPFHFWQPDAHSAAPSPVSAMLSGVLVKVGFYGIVRMSVLLFPGAGVLTVLAPLGAVSVLFGGLSALANNNLKRLLAYSTIANMGFILLALGWGGQAGMVAAIINAVNHAIIKAGLFLSGGSITDRLGEQSMSNLGGIARLAPGSAMAFGVGAMALAGLPPLSGFLSKLSLFQAGLAGPNPAWLVVVVIGSALGIAYSIRAFVKVYWGETPKAVIDKWAEREGTTGIPAGLLLLALIYITIGIWPQPFISLVTSASAELLSVEIYVDAVLGSSF